MSVKMGLYGVNKADPLKQRTARQGVLTYAQISQARAVPAELSSRYPAPE